MRIKPEWVRKMKLIDEYVFDYSSDTTLDVFLHQLNINCHMRRYDIEIILKGSSKCEIYLSPQKKCSMIDHAFRPWIFIEVLNGSTDGLQVKVKCNRRKEYIELLKLLRIVFFVALVVPWLFIEDVMGRWYYALFMLYMVIAFIILSYYNSTKWIVKQILP